MLDEKLVRFFIKEELISQFVGRRFKSADRMVANRLLNTSTDVEALWTEIGVISHRLIDRMFFPKNDAQNKLNRKVLLW
ncbi:hypothetical protein M3231_04200 [Neobacillus mesonae]|nr:hypothetical protein [Neobacillus mesonae]